MIIQGPNELIAVVDVPFCPERASKKTEHTILGPLSENMAYLAHFQEIRIHTSISACIQHLVQK